MATRNLTKKFVQLRIEAKERRSSQQPGLDYYDIDGDPHSGLFSSVGDSVVNPMFAGASPPPQWMEDIKRTEVIITNIEKKIKELGLLHSERLKVRFDSDEEQQEFEIEMKTRDITDAFRDAESMLQKFGTSENKGKIPPSELTIRVNIQRSVAKRLQGLSGSFRTSQKAYLRSLNALKSPTSDKDFFGIETKNVVEYVDAGFNSQQLAAVDDMVELVDQRDAEIVKIAQSIEELAAIFKELAVMIIDQGTVLDRIDFNMEQAVEHAEEGIEELKKAEEHQENAMPLKCIVLLVVLIIIAMILLITKETSGLQPQNK